MSGATAAILQKDSICKASPLSVGSMPASIKIANNIRNDMHNMRVFFNFKFLINFYTPNFCNFAYIVSAQIKQHKMFRNFFLSFRSSFWNLLSSLKFLPLGLVPAIGLMVILLSLTLTNISGLLPAILKLSKLKKNIKGDGFNILNFL